MRQRSSLIPLIEKIKDFKEKVFSEESWESTKIQEKNKNATKVACLYGYSELL